MSNNIHFVESGSSLLKTDQDSVDSAHYQMFKAVYGPIGTYTVVSASNGLPVQQQGVWVSSGVYNTSPPTLTNGSSGQLQLDSSGRLMVNVAAGGGSGGTSATFAAAFPGTGTACGFKDSTGTNMVPGNLDASGYLKVNVAAGSTGNTAASAVASPVPANAGYNGINIAGTLRGQTGVNPTGGMYCPQTDISSVGGAVMVLGPRLMTQSLSVTVASNQSAIPVEGTFYPATQPVSGTVAVSSVGGVVTEAKDFGRTAISLVVDHVATVTSESLASLTINSAGTTSTSTGYTVSALKTFRIQSITVSIRTTAAAIVSGRVRVRVAATVLVSSPIVFETELSSGAAVAESVGVVSIPIPDGLEIATGQSIGISQLCSATTGTLTVTLVGYEY